MAKNKPSRYDLPGSRILIRSLRLCEKRLDDLLGPGESPEREELAARLQKVVRDFFVVRLLEDRRVIKDWHLCGGKRSNPFETERALGLLLELNEWAGFRLFDLDAWTGPGLGPEASELYHELHLSRFWPAAMPVETLGALWEESLPTPRRSGVYYTPRTVVGIICDWALPPLDSGGKNGPRRILDPCCGAGYFLCEVFRRLIKQETDRYLAGSSVLTPLVKGESGRQVLDPVRRMELIRDHLFGVDVDADALDLARRSLFILAVSDTEASAGRPLDPSMLFNNLREGDSILEESLPRQASLFEETPPPPNKPFNWRDTDAGFGAVMEEGGFDCVIGNPPWVSLKGRHRQAPYGQDVVEFLIRHYQADSYRPNIVEFFVRRTMELLKDGGWNSFVVPDRIAENEQFAPLRKFMLERGEVVRLHYREPFPGVAADTLIYLFNKRRKPRRSARIAVTDTSGKNIQAPQSFWLKGEGYLPADLPSDELEQVLGTIESNGRRKLSDFMETGVGFIAKPGLITAERESGEQTEIIKGEHVYPYARDGQGYFVFNVDNLAGGTRSLKKLARPERILLRKTGARLIAAIDRTGHLPEQSLYFAYLRDRRLSRPYDLRFFLGILNSRVMSLYFRHRKITNRATTPQIKKVHLDSLPVRPIYFNDPEACDLHDNLAAAAGEREEAKPGERSAINDRVDRLVARIYGLDDKQLELVLKEMDEDWE